LVFLPDSLEKADRLVFQTISREEERQRRKIILIASESICPQAVRDALACEFVSIYAEGYPSPRTLVEPRPALESFAHQLAYYRRYSNRRYYKGCEYVDFLEALCRRRAAELFANPRASADKIFANVQPLSGAAANNAVYNAFLRPGEVVLGPSLTHGGHLTHGSEVNRSGIIHRVVHYEISPSGKLDYEAVRKLAREHRPKMIIGGFSAYPWDVDWQKLREAADEVGAILLADIAHLAGMVAAGLLNNPVGVAHVVSFTTHKTLCGPRGAMLLCTDPEIARRLDFGVFPGEQGGPHINQLAAKAVALEFAKSEQFRTLQKRVLENARALADGLRAEGLELAYGGTNTHMCLVDLRKLKTPNGQPLTGEIASRLLDLCGIVCNKNTIYGDTNAIHPSGLRFGATWATQRGFGPQHMQRLANLIGRVLKSIEPFTYISGKHDRGRGKIRQAVAEEVSTEVRRLLDEVDPPRDSDSTGYPHFGGIPAERSTPLKALHASQAVQLEERQGWRVPALFGEAGAEKRALTQGAALVDLGNSLLLEFGLGRAALFLENACSAPVLSMQAGENKVVAFFGPEGRLLARARLLRLPDDEMGYDRFLLRAEAERPEEFLAWLRGLSDGYWWQDEDIWLKAEGPVVIEDLHNPSGDGEKWCALGLLGPQAEKVAERAFSVSLPPAGRALERDGLWLVNTGSGFELYAPTGRAAAVWSRLREAGAVAVGWKTLDEARSGRIEQVEPALEKVFFIGQKALLKERRPSEKGPQPFSWRPSEQPLKETCLIGEHRQLTSPKHLVPFAGWRMPVMYSGILAEHRAVRNAAGLFDVSHMGLLEFTGPQAERFLDLVSTNYVPQLAPGQAQYSYLLAPDGRCIDDIIIYRLEKEKFFVVVNAANADEDEAWLRSVIEGRVLIDEDRPWLKFEGRVNMRNLKDPACGEDCRVDLALQGPRSLDLLKKLVDDSERLQRLGKFELASCRLAGMEVVVARTGYTGEALGCEIFVHPGRAVELWRLLLEKGQELGLVPCGLGARDSLRTEAGFPLHGHELAGPHQVNPIEAGYGAYVRLHKPFFIGRKQALKWHLERNRRVVRFEVDEKGGKVLRPGSPVLAGRKNEYAGVVTSVVATEERQVGLALLDSSFAREGSTIHILPLTAHDPQPPARSPAELKQGDWMAVPRRATILDRFMKPGEKPLA